MAETTVHIAGLNGVLEMLQRMPAEVVKATGVYAIVNLVNGKAYIGSAAASFAKRFRNHKHDLVRGEHHSQPLQRAWNKYGEDAFEFAPIEFSAPGAAVEIEQRYIDTWRPAYNVSPTARSALGVKHTEASKERMRAGMIASNARPEVKALRSSVQKALWAQPHFKARKAASQNRPDVRARKSASTLATWGDPTIVARRIDGMKAAQSLPESKAKRSAITKKMWEDPDYRAERSEQTKRRWSDPDYRARMSAMSKETHAIPGARELRAASISAAGRARSRITPEIAAAIQKALSQGSTGKELAEKHGVSAALVSTIKIGTHWACKT